MKHSRIVMKKRNIFGATKTVVCSMKEVFNHSLYIESEPLDVTVTITNKEFNEDLADKSSEEYKNLATPLKEGVSWNAYVYV